MQRLVLDHPEDDLTLRTLARVAFASRRLTETADSPESIAREVGFGTEATLRRAFLQVMRISPIEYRERFT
ncbi:helix-turn-helix domain-containing protein [Streptomyces sp. NPDC021622]|uniref:helix-turn-helix domain-containing protein n=1 Tax=Streptomyces sp. NPDC021622 TaxID=3155013 RepID=UPI0033E84F6C